MSQLGRRAANLTVWTLRLLTVAAVLVAVIAVVWLRRTAGPAPATAAATEPSPALAEAVRAAATPSPAGDNRPPPEKPELKGPTRFVRRLEAGELLRELSVPAESDYARATHRLLDLLPALLHADRFRPAPRLTREALSGAIDFLTHPPRDLRRVRLFGRAAEDPLGQDKLVRVWTLRNGYAEAELGRAEATLRHVAGVAQVQLPAGVDVMVTPKMGRDVFPRQPGCAWAAGVYFIHDRYCAVRSGLSPLIREEVLKHELIHAYCRQFTRGFTSSQFVSEGLAEYLRYCRPSDHGFHVPVACFAGNLARLQRMLQESGFPLARVTPRLLVELPPRGFYALRSLGYLLAQAAMAYIGGNAIEWAFRDRRDDAIVEAVAAIHWPDFLRFVAKHADDQATALTVEDIVPLEEPTGGSTRQDLREVVFALGVDGEIDAKALVAYPNELISAEGQIAAVLRALLAPGPAPLLYTDISEAMDREIALAEVPDAFQPLTARSLDAATPRGFVARLYALLRRRRPAASDPRLVALAPKDVAYPLDRTDSYSVAPFFEHLRAGTAGPRVILCIASSGFSKRGWRNLAVDPLRPLAMPKVLLVIDLSDGDGDALPLTKYLVSGEQHLGLVACWNPQRR